MTDLNKKPHAGGRGASEGVGSGERQTQFMANIEGVRLMPLTILLDRLAGVQKSGTGYRARCPSCSGKSRKLSVSESHASVLLVHCFGGCPVAEVLEAVGLTTADLFEKVMPDNSPESRRLRRRNYQLEFLGSAIEVLAFEAEVVLAASRHVQAGVALNVDDEKRLAQAIARISDARLTLRG